MSQYSKPAWKYLKLCCCVQSHSPTERITQRTKRAKMGFLKHSLSALLCQLSLLTNCIQKDRSYLCSSHGTNTLSGAIQLPVSFTSFKNLSSVSTSFPVRLDAQSSNLFILYPQCSYKCFCLPPINSHQNNLQSTLICTFNPCFLASLAGTG